MPQYYPALNKLLQLNKIPEPLSSPVASIIDKLFYKAYYAERSIHGDVAYHNITIVLNSEIGLNLFGGEEGFEILFNRGQTTDTTEIPLALYYNLPILRYVRTVSASQLSSPKDFFDVIIEIISKWVAKNKRHFLCPKSWAGMNGEALTEGKRMRTGDSGDGWGWVGPSRPFGIRFFWFVFSKKNEQQQ